MDPQQSNEATTAAVFTAFANLWLQLGAIVLSLNKVVHANEIQANLDQLRMLPEVQAVFDTIRQKRFEDVASLLRNFQGTIQ